MIKKEIIGKELQSEREDKMEKELQSNMADKMEKKLHLERSYEMGKELQSEFLQDVHRNLQTSMPIEKKDNIIYQIWRVIYPALFYYLVSVVVQMVFMVIFSFVAAVQSQGDMNQMTNILIELTMQNVIVMLMIGALVTIPLFLWLLKLDFEKDNFKNGKIEFEKPKTIHWVFTVILAVTFCLSMNGMIGLSRIQEIFPGFEEVAEYIYSGGILMQILSVGIVVPVVEELIFRGLAYKRLERYGNWKTAMVVSSLFFGVYHMNAVQFIYATIMGLLFAYLYHKMKTIWAPIVLHCTANIVSVLITNVAVLSEMWENQIFEIVITVLTALIGVYTWKLSTKINLPRIQSGTRGIEK